MFNFAKIITEYIISSSLYYQIKQKMYIRERMEAMRLMKRVLCLLMAVVLLLVTAGCGEEEPKKKKQKVVIIKRPNTSDQSEENDNSDANGETDDSQDVIYGEGDSHFYLSDRELADTSEEGVNGEVFEKEFDVKAVPWNGPNGYSIVYPDGNEQLRQSANKLAAYFAKNGVSLEVYSDKKAAKSKEILVGDTNRRKSKLTEKQFAVTLDGNKLCFESGNFNGAVKAAKWFITLKYEKGKVNTLSGEYDFTSEKTRPDGNYKFVWGDDFDGEGLDSSIWDLSTIMTGESSFTITRDKRAINVSDGRLKLSALRWFDPDNDQIQAAAIYTVESKKHVNYQYGYLEMRARIPFQQGAWPALWVSGNCIDGSDAVVSSIFPNGDIIPTDFTSEIDIIEYTTLTPNLHKWYMSDQDAFGIKDRHSSLGAVAERPHLYPNDENAYVYHTVGFDWSPKGMTVSFDGEAIYSYNWKESVQLDAKNDMSDFLNPVFIRFNNHIQDDKMPADYSTLPCEYYIDYIRLYQKDGEGGLWLAE